MEDGVGLNNASSGLDKINHQSIISQRVILDSQGH